MLAGRGRWGIQGITEAPALGAESIGGTRDGGGQRGSGALQRVYGGSRCACFGKLVEGGSRRRGATRTGGTHTGVGGAVDAQEAFGVLCIEGTGGTRAGEGVLEVARGPAGPGQGSIPALRCKRVQWGGSGAVGTLHHGSWKVGEGTERGGQGSRGGLHTGGHRVGGAQEAIGDSRCLGAHAAGNRMQGGRSCCGP